MRSILSTATVLLIATTLAGVSSTSAIAKLQPGHHDGISLPERIIPAVERNPRQQTRAERADPAGLFRRQDAATCDAGYTLCGGKHASGCCQEGATCCGDGGCCSAGYNCYTYEKKKGCCQEGKICSGFSGTCTTSQYFPCQEDHNSCCPIGAKCLTNDRGQVVSCGGKAGMSGSSSSSSAAAGASSTAAGAKSSGTLEASTSSASLNMATSAQLAFQAAAAGCALAGAWLL